MSIEFIKQEYRNSLFCWFCYDFFLPIFFTVGFWPVAQFLVKTPFAFEKVFSSADLLLVASLLMLSSSREIDIENKLNRISCDMHVYKQLGIVIPIVLLFMYCVLKYYSITYQFPMKPGEPIDDVIRLIPYLSFTAVSMAGVFCNMTKWGIIRSLNQNICQ